MGKTTFAGKRCFITGAASGIGRATALRLPGPGAEPYLTDLNADGLVETGKEVCGLGAQVAEYRALDIANYDEVASFAEAIHANHPSMDLVMNIAGVSAWGTVDRLSHEQWEKMISINLMGPIHVIESFLPPMVAARRGGHLVNVSSAAGLIGLPWHAAYSASKFGVRGLAAPADPLEIARVAPRATQVSRWVNRFSGLAVSPEKAADKILAGITKN